MDKIDLSEIIATTVEKVIETDLTKAVEKEVKECLSSVIDDIFGYNSDARKNLKEKFSSQIAICLENLKIENYNMMVLNAIQDTINGELSKRVEERIKEGILSSISILDKSSYKLSEIVEEFKRELLGDMDDYEGHEFTVIVKNSSCDFVYIYFDKEEYQEEYRCKYRIMLYEGKVSSCTPILKPENNAYGFENFLFALYANKVNVEIDSYDTYVSKGDYD